MSIVADPPPPVEPTRNKSTGLIVLSGVAVAVATVALVLVLLQRQQVSGLEDDIGKLEQRLDVIEDGVLDLSNGVSNVQTDVANVPDPSTEIAEINDLIDGALLRIDQVAQCNNRNWEEYVTSTNDERAGSFEGC